MKCTFKPNVEKLEDRLVMSTVAGQLYANFQFEPAATPEVKFNLNSFAGQTVRVRMDEVNNPEVLDVKNLGAYDPISTIGDERMSYVMLGTPPDSAIAFVGGWGSSSYQYAFAGTYANSAFGGEGRDVLLGGAGDDVLIGGAGQDARSANTPILFQALTSNEQAIQRIPDDIWVDGKIITAPDDQGAFEITSPAPGESEVVGGTIHVYFHVIRRSSTATGDGRYTFAFDGNGSASSDSGHGTHTPGTVAAVGNNAVLPEHEVGHWMDVGTPHAPAVEASGMTLKGQKILQNAPDDGAAAQ